MRRRLFGNSKRLVLASYPNQKILVIESNALNAL